MEEMLQPTPPSQPSAMGPLMIGIAIGLVIGVGAYYAWNSRVRLVSTSNTSGTASTTSDATSTLNSYPTTWKTSKISELGIELSYPDDWQSLSFAKKTVAVGVTSSTGGTYWSGTKNGAASDSSLYLSVSSKGYKEAFGTNLSAQVDPSWTKDQFVKNSELTAANIVYYKNLSNKSLLVANYEAPECSPNVVLKVYAPFVEDFPTLAITVPQSFDKDPSVVAYGSQQSATSDAACEQLPIYQQLADGWVKNGFPADVQANIDIARQIANSVRPITQ